MAVRGEPVAGLRPVVIVGAGGHGREVLDVLEAMATAGTSEFEFAGFVDDGDPDLEVIRRRGATVLGPAQVLEKLDADYLIGIGEGALRRRMDELITGLGRVPAEAVHPSAVIGSCNDWGPGLVVWANASITTNVQFGRHVHVNQAVTIGHDCRIGDYVTILPGANVSGGVDLGPDVTIGAGAVVLPHVTVGNAARVGAGAVVVDDVSPGVTAMGVPARSVR